MREYLKHNVDMLLLISGTVPLTYQYLTGLHIPILVYLCSIASAIALEFVLIKQIKQERTNIYGSLSIIIASLFLVLIALASYLPAGLHTAGVLSQEQYGIIKAILEAIIHSVFAILILCTALSKRYNEQTVGMDKHLEQYKKEVEAGFVCDSCGKVYKTQAALKAHKTRSHK